MASTTLLSAVTTETTSANQAVKGVCTLVVSTTGSGSLVDLGPIEIYIQDVLADTMFNEAVKNIIVGTANLKVKAVGTTANPITVSVHDET